MGKADTVRNLGLSLDGQPYKLGEEFWYVQGLEQTPYKLDGDCSSTPYSIFRRAGVLVNGKPLPRRTAHDYYLMGSPIAAPTKVGDLGFLLKNGHAYHTFMYIGLGQVVEAGWQHKVRITTVAVENARGCEWRRLNTDIGELSPEQGDTLMAGIGVDNPNGATAEVALQWLVDHKFIQAGHPLDTAAGSSLLWIVIQRLVARVEELEKKGLGT